MATAPSNKDENMEVNSFQDLKKYLDSKFENIDKKVTALYAVQNQNKDIGQINELNIFDVSILDK